MNEVIDPFRLIFLRMEIKRGKENFDILRDFQFLLSIFVKCNFPEIYAIFLPSLINLSQNSFNANLIQSCVINCASFHPEFDESNFLFKFLTPFFLSSLTHIIISHFPGRIMKHDNSKQTNFACRTKQ